MAHPAVLALEDGTVFQGKAIGAVGNAQSIAFGEVVFNTAMTGYQEILTDPSYCNQLITLTYPHIGNVGINSEDLESKRIYAKGLIIRDLPFLASNWRKKHTLEEWLKTQNVIGIKNIDTRKLTRLLREKGSLKGCILTNTIINKESIEYAVQRAESAPSMQGCDLAQEVTTDSPYIWPSNTRLQNLHFIQHYKNHANYKVIVYDFGVKYSILKSLHDLGLSVYVVPATTKITEILSLKPDGIFFSNGPGDPQACLYAIETMKECLRLKFPIFGICLGFQILTLALGAKTYKMKFGHHGGNHPVQDLESKSVMITSQNHGFAVEESSLPRAVTITHRSLFDNTIQGISHLTLPAFGFQGHPEAGPGPHDARALFLRFFAMVKAFASQKNQSVSLEI